MGRVTQENHQDSAITRRSLKNFLPSSPREGRARSRKKEGEEKHGEDLVGGLPPYLGRVRRLEFGKDVYRY